VDYLSDYVLKPSATNGSTNFKSKRHRPINQVQIEWILRMEITIVT